MKFRHFSSFLVIERTKTFHVVKSDLIVTCFGNDTRFMTRSDHKCSSGQRTRIPYCSSPQKVFPNRGVINGVKNVKTVRPLGQTDSKTSVLLKTRICHKTAALCNLDMILPCHKTVFSVFFSVFIKTVFSGFAEKCHF